MPGPGHRSKPKKSSPAAGSSSQAVIDPVVPDLDNAKEWESVVDVLLNYFDLPDLSTRSGLKKVHANFERIHRKLDKTYVRNANNVRVRGGIVGIYTRMCCDAILRTKILEKGFLDQLLSLIEIPSCRHLALRALSTVTHHGGVEVRLKIAKESSAILLKTMADLPDDGQAVSLAVATLSHCILAAVDEPGEEKDLDLIKRLPLRDIVLTVTHALRRHPRDRQMQEHAISLLANCTMHCDVPPTTVNLLVAGLRSRDWTLRCICLGGLVRLHRESSEEDIQMFDPNNLIQAAQKGAPGPVADILSAYGVLRCETTLTAQCTVAFQRTMYKILDDHDLYALGLTIAGLIVRTEFSIFDGYFETVNPRTGSREQMDTGLPFQTWADSLPHCAKAIRAQGKPDEADLADVLDLKHLIRKQRHGDAALLANNALKRNPGFAYAYYALSLSADHEVGMRAAKKGIKCTNITPFIRFQLMQRAVDHAGDFGIRILQGAAAVEGGHKWEEGIAFLMSALEDSETYIAEAPPDNRNMRNVLYWNILLRIAMDEHVSSDLRELQTTLRRLKVADDIAKWLRLRTPQTIMRLTQRKVVNLFPGAMAEWGDFISVHTGQTASNPEPERLEDDLASWLEGNHGDEDAHRGQHHPSPTFDMQNVALFRCSRCGNPSAILRKCGGCAKTRYCDPTCQKAHWKEHKKFCIRNDSAE
ncbi:unnamed protein product [Mycena citricolor]|uniref:MYND-type domain-containing protein n=1 Tax=Mycena citricolor TaxID=2018698 RepID=A0AAD2H3N5_9AGAR|nr:unnamed protein product [Mycena citricolor]